MASQEYAVVDCPPFGSFKVAATSDMIRWRAKSFHTKEPTTIEWLQSLEKDSVLIDIGANIGIYTVPAALFHVKKVIAVEPEIKNYSELIKNIELNNIDESVDALPLAISTELANTTSNIYLAKDEPGMSCHQVGRNQDFKLTPLSKQRKKRSVYCVSLSSIVEKVHSEFPTSPIHVKVDVDGIEEDVCQSLFDSCAINFINSLQIELNPAIQQHKNLIKKLHWQGFSFSKLQVAKASRTSGTFEGFAEHVFRRYMSEHVASAIPARISSKYSHLSHYNEDITGFALGFPSNLPINDLFTSREINPFPISSTPPALVLPKFLSNLECLSAFTSLSQSIVESKSFEFDTVSEFKKESDDMRRCISTYRLKDTNKRYVNFLIDLIQSKKLVKQFYNSSRFLIKKYVNLDNESPLNPSKFIRVRVRHFLDLQGFYLTKHNDSYDTMYAFICPLNQNASGTSFFNEAPETHLRSRVPIDDSLFKLESQFSKGYFWESAPHSLGIVNGKKRDKPSITSTYSQSSYLNNGDALIIPNIVSDAYVSEGTRYRNDPFTTGHGVFPPIPDLLRPVLLIDYLVLDFKGTEKFGKTFVQDDALGCDLCPLIDLLDND